MVALNDSLLEKKKKEKEKKRKKKEGKIHMDLKI